MIRRYFKKSLLLLIIIILVFPLFVNAGTPTLKNVDIFTSSAGSSGGYYIAGESYKTLNIVSLIIQIALSLIGIIFLILTIYSGYLWMTARGNEEQVTKAKSIITAAIIGLVIVISAYAISYFVISTIGESTLNS